MPILDATTKSTVKIDMDKFKRDNYKVIVTGMNYRLQYSNLEQISENIMIVAY